MTKNEAKQLQRGQKIFANGYEGTFIKYMFEGVIEIKLPGGYVDLDCHDVIIVK